MLKTLNSDFLDGEDTLRESQRRSPRILRNPAYNGDPADQHQYITMGVNASSFTR